METCDGKPGLCRAISEGDVNYDGRPIIEKVNFKTH